MDEKLYENAINAITELFNDSDVSKAETAENLNSLIGEIETMIESLGEI